MDLFNMLNCLKNLHKKILMAARNINNNRLKKRMDDRRTSIGNREDSFREKKLQRNIFFSNLSVYTSLQDKNDER